MVWYVGSPSYAPSASTVETGPSIWSSSGPTREASPSSVVVSSAARISLLSGSTARCSRRQLRRGLPPCFSCSHSPAPKIFSPLESITTLTGPFGFFSAVVNDRPTGQGGVVRHRQVKAEHLDDGAQHSFGLAPRLAHRQAQHHSSFDDNVRVGRRPPASSSLLVPRPPALRASPTPSGCPAAAEPRHTPASWKLCTWLSRFCDGAVRCACTAWGLSATGMPLYPPQPAAETDLCTKAYKGVSVTAFGQINWL